MAHCLAGKRILIIEDEFIIAHDLADEIATVGAKAIGPVATVNAALDVIANTELDGAIIDINLRGETAFPVADVLAERHIPFVFATAVEPPDIPPRYANVCSIQKPAKWKAISRALEAAIMHSDDGAISPCASQGRRTLR